MRTALLPLLTLPLLCSGFSNSADSIALKPKSGLVLRKTFEEIFRFEQEGSQGEATVGTQQYSAITLTVLDTILEADTLRATRMQRVYEQLEASRKMIMELGTDSRKTSAEGASELIGETVEFHWDADNDTYGISCDADVDLSKEPRFDLDLSRLLPEGEVEEGDTWSIEAELFQDAVDFLAGLPLEWTSTPKAGGPRGAGQGGQPSSGENNPLQEEYSADGGLELTYVGTRSVDGSLLAVIRLEGEIESELLRERSRSTEGRSYEMHSIRNKTATIEGELLWHIEGGHVHALTLESSEETEETIETAINVDGQEHGGVSTSTGSGIRTITVSFERVE